MTKGVKNLKSDDVFYERPLKKLCECDGYFFQLVVEIRTPIYGSFSVVAFIFEQF